MVPLFNLVEPTTPPIKLTLFLCWHVQKPTFVQKNILGFSMVTVPEGFETQDEEEDDATTRVPNYCSNRRINDLPEVQPSFPPFCKQLLLNI